MKSIPLLLMAFSMALTSLKAQSFQHSWGFSFDLLRYQTYSFTQYSPTRPPHLVTPPPVSDWLFTMRYNPRWGLLKAKETRKLNLELNFPVDIGLFYTTDQYQKKSNYFVMHLPAMLGLAFGEGSSPIATSKSKFGGYVAGGAALNVFSGVLGKKEYITPCASVGIRALMENKARMRKRIIELSYTLGFLPKKENIFYTDFGVPVTSIEKNYLRNFLKYSQNLVSLTFSFRNKSQSK